jgi:dethiobiotin synthetase
MGHPSVRRVVVLGTGTDVGKTFVTAALASRLATQGDAVAATKPIETGRAARSDGPAPGSDAERLELASRSVIRPHPLHVYPEPVSAHLAAKRAGRTIEIGDIGAWAADAESNLINTTLHYTTYRWLLIETAGGALSPLAPGVSNLDLAAALEPAVWLLVAPDNLGVLHDLHATLVAMRTLARLPDLVALSAARPPDASTGTNAAELVHLAIVTPAAVLDRDSTEGALALAAALRAWPAKG